MARKRHIATMSPAEKSGEGLVILQRAAGWRDVCLRFGVSKRSLDRFVATRPWIVKRFGDRSLYDLAAMDAAFDTLPTASEVPSKRRGNAIAAKTKQAQA